MKKATIIKATVRTNPDFHYADYKPLPNPKLVLIIKNRKLHISEMLKMDKKKLDKNYSLILLQMKMAYEAKNDKAYSILFEMENQVLEALVLKM